MSPEIAAVPNSLSAVVRADGEFPEVCRLLVFAVFQRPPVLSRCWLSTSNRSCFSPGRNFHKDIHQECLFFPDVLFFPDGFFTQLLPASRCSCHTAALRPSTQRHLVSQQTRGSAVNQLPPCVSPPSLVAFPEILVASLCVCPSFACRQRGWGCKHRWGSAGVNELSTVLKYSQHHFAGVFLSHGGAVAGKDRWTNPFHT